MKRSPFCLVIPAVAAITLAAAQGAEAACTGASPTWTSTPDHDSVAACVASASAGDTINISAGAESWSGLGTITVSKRLTIIGAGSGCPASCDDATTIRVGSTMAFQVTASNVRISALTFEGPAAAYGSILINKTGTSSATDWRIDHCHFKDTTGRGITVAAYASEAGYSRDFPGLIDNNRFSAAVHFKAVEVYGGSLGTHGSWDETLELGGTSFVFIEDNYFVASSLSGVASIDGDTGARYVIRYNTFINGDIAAHGIETGDPTGSGVSMWRSTHGWEIYGNTFSYTANHYFVLNIRGGTGVIFDNTVSGTAAVFPAVRYLYERGDIERSCLDAQACKGVNKFDGNEPGKYGYPCYHQIGVTGSNGITRMPVYQWGGIYYGNTGEYAYTGATFDKACNYKHVQQGRDYIAAASGPIASRPARCTIDDAYWATDEGEWNGSKAGPDGRLYKCIAADTWALYYTPFFYPHPQRRVPAAPSTLRIR